MPNGLSFAHVGDQCNNKDFEWIDEIANHHKVDVLMPNSFTTDIKRTVKGFDPNIIITGHENELSHTIDYREPYWRSYLRKEGQENYNYPLILMTWGELLCYNRNEL